MIFLVFLVLATFSFTGTLFASQETVPGQVLYPLKRSFEDFKLIVYPENKRDDLHFQFLNNRIDEANTILVSDGSDDTGILVEELIEEIDNEYRICKQYNYFSSWDEDRVLDSINNVKNKYSFRYGKNQNNSTGNGHDKNMGSDQDNGNCDDQDMDAGSSHESTGNGGPQNKNGGGSGNANK